LLLVRVVESAQTITAQVFLEKKKTADFLVQGLPEFEKTWFFNFLFLCLLDSELGLTYPITAWQTDRYWQQSFSN